MKVISKVMWLFLIPKIRKRGDSMAGRNRKMLSVIQGNLTKEQIKERQIHEERMRGPTENIEAPTYLTAAQKREFDDIASKLVALGIFSELDVDNLARYLDSKYQYIQIVKELKKIKPTETIVNDDGRKTTIVNDDYPKLQRTKKNLFDECRSAAADLGLTITSRLKLVIPEPPEKEQKTEAEKRFGGRL